MSASNFKDHFSSGAEGYAAYRPSYPIRLVDELAELSPGRALAIDCGCGSGQLSVLLAERFAEVVATDASAAQIEKAQPHERVTYRTALAEETGLPDGSVDLVTVAQAAHWLDLDKFYAEVRRVARPDAIIALITYGVLHGESGVEPVIQRFYHETVAPYWPAERRHVEDGYRSLPFPFPELRLPNLAIEVSWTLEELVDYVRTWSAVKAAEKLVGPGMIERFREELAAVWGAAETPRRIVWPLSLRVGRVK
jgi:SAM-dependent methyltransferase